MAILNYKGETQDTFYGSNDECDPYRVHIIVDGERQEAWAIEKLQSDCSCGRNEFDREAIRFTLPHGLYSEKMLEETCQNDELIQQLLKSYLETGKFCEDTRQEAEDNFMTCYSGDLFDEYEDALDL